jgi:hypothetical protein
MECLDSRFRGNDDKELGMRFFGPWRVFQRRALPY